MKTFKTPNGTELPLLNLKGKDYLQVPQRMVWLNESAKKFKITSEFLLISEEQTICKARVWIYDEGGNELKYAEATKRETKKDFNDHTEKSETSAIGRALAMCGYGTAFTANEFDEGDRLADSPLPSVPKGKRIEIEKPKSKNQSSDF